MLSFGLLVRASESELQKMKQFNEDNQEKAKVLKEEFRSSEEKLKGLSSELEERIDYEVIPIKKLVSIQLECGLLMAEYLKHSNTI